MFNVLFKVVIIDDQIKEIDDHIKMSNNYVSYQVTCIDLNNESDYTFNTNKIVRRIICIEEV